MAELQGLQSRYEDFAERDADVLAVVVDPIDKNAEVVADLGLGYRVLADPEMKAIDAYGLRHPAGYEGKDIALSATFLIDASGKVVWRNVTQNFRVRPRPEEILAHLDALPH